MSHTSLYTHPCQKLALKLPLKGNVVQWVFKEDNKMAHTTMQVGRHIAKSKISIMHIPGRPNGCRDVQHNRGIECLRNNTM